MLLITNVIVIIKRTIIDNQYQYLIFFLLFMLLIVVVIILQFIIYVRYRKKLAIYNHITNIVHDCKTPITTINLVCQTMEDVDINSEENLKYYSDIVKAESSKLIVMIENLLNFICLNNVNLDFGQRVDVHQVITDAVESMKLLVRNLDGEITMLLHSDSYYVRGNCDMMLSIIANILNNAIKYTVSSPRIIISTRTIVDNIEISIKDNGIGMEKKELDNIFDRAYRVPSSSVSCSGSGFGLYYVKENVMKMNGKIIVISSSGNGSEFRITLPIVKF